MLQSDIFNKMTLHAKKSLTQAIDLASHHSADPVRPIHLLFAIYLERGSLGANILQEMGFREKNFDSLTSKSKKITAKKNLAIKNPYSKELQNIIVRAYFLANNLKSTHIGTEHLVYALIESSDEEIKNLIKKSSLKKMTPETFSRPFPNEESFPDPLSSLSFPDAKLLSAKVNNLGKNNSLGQFCININEEVAKQKTIISGRDQETERLIHILGRKNKNNPLLIGDPGVGKTALVAGLGQKINSGNVPSYLVDKTIFSLDMALVVAGTTFRGEFENRLKDIITEASQNKNIILFIDEIHIIVGAGNSQGGLDAANILKPALSRGDIHCIGATTYSEYKKYIEKDPALARRFQPIRLPEPSIEETIDILEKIKNQYEKFHNVSIEKSAIRSAVELSVKYINDRFLPDKAIDLLDETASAIKTNPASLDYSKKLKLLEKKYQIILTEKERLIQIQKYEEALDFQKKEKYLQAEISLLKKEYNKNKGNSVLLTANDIANTIAKITGIPKEKIVAQKANLKIIDLEKNLQKKISGQSKAIRLISEVLLRSHSGITNADRPMGSFLFLGPTGVGKTLTAKIIAQEIFSTENSIIKIDMSEFSEKHNVARLIGAPAGYVGFGEGGLLTEKVRHRPYSLILFDEIEKAHPDILNILLQILEDGKLTDAEGREVNFANTIIILTSNLGISEFTGNARFGFSQENSVIKISPDFERPDKEILKKLSENIKPEILNRLDHVIIFNSLSKKDILTIVSREIESLINRLGHQGFFINVSPAVKNFIAQKSLATEYGARLVRKNIQDLLETQIAKFILSTPDKKKVSLLLKNNQIIAK